MLLHRVGGVNGSCFSDESVMIDHHQKPDDYALHVFVHLSRSTCEMLYNSFLFTKKEEPAWDTNRFRNSFRFPGTTGNTHRIVAELIDLVLIENTKISTLL
jgi:phosphoesterase RecJ-like protein